MIGRSLLDHVNALAHYLPNGPLFEAKNIDDSNFRQLLTGFAGELFTAQGYLTTLNNEYLPKATNLFLNEWERALGIPDECFSGTGTPDERRNSILLKLAALGVQTLQDFEDLAALAGIVITITPGVESSISFNSIHEARCSIVIAIVTGESFPYTFPLPFGGPPEVFLKCIFEKIKPSNCQIIYTSV